MTTPVKENAPRIPPYKTAAVVFLVVAALVLALVYGAVSGRVHAEATLTMVARPGGLGDGPGVEGHLQRGRDRPGGKHFRDRA